MQTLTHEEWIAEGKRRFGDDFEQWKFVCPVCSHVASVGDFKPYRDKGATMQSATAECIGRYAHAPGHFKNKTVAKGQGPCDYAGYGLFRLSPVRVLVEGGKETHCFAFGD